MVFSYFCHAYIYILHQQKYYQMHKCKLEVSWAVSEPKLVITAAVLTQLRDNYGPLHALKRGGLWKVFPTESGFVYISCHFSSVVFHWSRS